jgi:hypothetical protein
LGIDTQDAAGGHQILRIGATHAGARSPAHGARVRQARGLLPRPAARRTPAGQRTRRRTLLPGQTRVTYMHYIMPMFSPEGKRLGIPKCHHINLLSSPIMGHRSSL